MNKPRSAFASEDESWRNLTHWIDSLERWEFPATDGKILRGWHSPGSGKPLIHFVHGNGYCGLVYAPLLHYLSEHFDLFISDVQGHGDSDFAGEFAGWNATAKQCYDVWQAHQSLWQGRTVFAAGHSFGGVMTALILARKHDAFKAAVLLDPVLFTPPLIGVMALSDSLGLWRLNALSRRTRKRQTSWESREAAYGYFYQRGMFRGWEDDALRCYVAYALSAAEDGRVQLKCPPALEAEIFGSYPRRLWQSVRQVRAPVRIIAGKQSYPFVPRAVSLASRMNENISGDLVPGKHCFMQEHPQQAALKTAAFLHQYL